MNPADLLHAIPYCRHLGARGEVKDGVLTLVMPFAPHLIGNMTIPALHGGVIASLLETAAIAQLAWETSSAGLPKPVDIAIDYLRTARAVESFARGRIAKQGRRVVHVRAEMWQDDESKPVAALRGNFLIAS